MSGPEPQAGELRLDPESIEAIARRLAELLGSGEEPRARKQLISAEAVSEWWGVSRRWVYENAKRLGVRRIGTGRRPRLRFDPDEVAEQLGEPTGRSGDGGALLMMRAWSWFATPPTAHPPSGAPRPTSIARSTR